MPFFDFAQMPLKDFRPGIKSFAQVGEQLILAVMTIESGMRDDGHAHPFDQCGMVLEGVFSLTIDGETRSPGTGAGLFCSRRNSPRLVDRGGAGKNRGCVGQTPGSGLSMRVLLISPNREVSPDPVYPLGLASLAAVLKAGGMTVKGSDLCFHPDWTKVLEQDLESFRPDCIGLSIRNIDNVTYPRSIAYLPFIKEVVDLCRLKTAVPRSWSAVRGFTLLPEGVLDFLGADFGVVGEGESAFLDLLEKMAADRLPRLSAGASPPGPSRDRIVTGEPIKELNALPWPDREVFDAAAYREQGGLTNIQSKRGCPFHCIYCTYPLIEGRSVRVRRTLGSGPGNPGPGGPRAGLYFFRGQQFQFSGGAGRGHLPGNYPAKGAGPLDGLCQPRFHDRPAG